MILFTADWHIKLGQKNVPVDWAVNRYELFFKQIHDLEEDYTLHIIGGDLFDRLPTMEELALYFQFLKGVQIPTIIFDGNHEATKKNKTFFTQLQAVSHAINPNVNVVVESIEDEEDHQPYSILPYCDLHKKQSIEQLNTKYPLFTHVRGEIPPHVKPEVDLDRFNDFPIVFAGDLHAHSNTQRNIVYPGSPMTTSFHRSKVSTGFLSIDPNDWSWTWGEFKLPQLLRKTVSSTEEMVPTDYDHTIYEVEGDLQELANVKNSDLLDKKLVKRSRDTALVLEKEMALDAELAEYLRYILEIDDNKIDQLLKTYHDYSAQVEME